MNIVSARVEVTLADGKTISIELESVEGRPIEGHLKLSTPRSGTPAWRS